MLSKSFTDIKYTIYALLYYKKRKQIYDNKLFGGHRKSEQYLRLQISLSSNKK